MTSIAPLCEVTAEYLLTDEQGERMAASPPTVPLHYVHGTGQLLPALEASLEGRQRGDEIHVTLTPDQAYGPHRPELVFEAVRDNLPPGQEIRVGMTLTPGGQRGKFSLKVVGLTERGAMLDGNHPLAGRTVCWTLKILGVKPGNQRPLGELDHQPIHWVAVDE
nr:FKBP-type peptidyl-prolyl cis-trans isomerase [Halomonas socia]